MQENKREKADANKTILRISVGVLVLFALFVIAFFIYNNTTIHSADNSQTNPNLDVSASPAPNCTVTLVDADTVYDGQIISKKQGDVYGDLPIPRADELDSKNPDLVFSGWHNDTQKGNRVGAGDDVICNSVLYGRWITKEENKAENVKVPILMFHYFTKKADDPAANADYMLASDFDKEMKYLHDNKYYYPSWKELSAFIDGKLVLPKKSVMVTDDDNEISWYDIGVPIINKYKIYSTMFCITGSWWESREKSPSKYIMQRSHTNGMHNPQNGHFIGYMASLPAATITKDLEESAKKLKAKEVVAYPSGEYNPVVEKGVKDAGFEMGVTTDPGFVEIGSNKLEMPRVRMSFGQSLESFIASLG
ncbi:MAG: polysaccharide deacetylase family protein [Bifidobacteriaceae bacterium]|jgi:hypothetical protein|nr:polysaccharide deacetylase family protein [Bifidobacteriaceae bacterium]